jgi:Icc-related predicted phosphoesterase
LSVFISILLAVAAMALVGYPLFTTSQLEGAEAVVPRRSNIIDTKEVIMTTLGEIEFDYHMKKLSEEDYRELKNNYSGTALQILKAQQQIDSSAKRGRKVTNNLGNIDREIEDDLIKLKGKETKGE